MVGDWSIVTIEEIKSPDAHALAMGPFGSDIKSDNFVSSGVPVIRGVNLGSGRFNDEDFVFLTEQKADELHSANAYPGDIIFTHRGTLGQVGIIPHNAQYPRYIVSQSQMKLSCDIKKADPLFIFYYFRSTFGQHQLLANTSTTGVPAISRPLTSLRSIQINLPTLSEQHAIAHILSTLDDKIELNYQINKTFESIARTIFKSWFVDFDPVRAKMEERAPYGMDIETASLFPDSLENSMLGMIPEGWGVGTLGEAVAINERNITKDYPHQIIEYIDISSVTEGRLEGTTSYDLTEAPSRAKRLVKHGDTIWSTVRPNRKSFLFIFNPVDNLIVSTGFVVLSPRLIPSSYLYAWVTTDQFVDYLTYNADGSAYPAVLPNRFADALILLPPSKILQRFEQLVEPLQVLIAHDEEEIDILTSIRDTLLPKLLSGEIKIKEAEKLLQDYSSTKEKIIWKF